jgi:hypothetical protein
MTFDRGFGKTRVGRLVARGGLRYVVELFHEESPDPGVSDRLPVERYRNGYSVAGEVVKLLWLDAERISISAYAMPSEFDSSSSTVDPDGSRNTLTAVACR